ncbi:hypothetical protein DICVIV_04687 [Dictyocaulus viviparus]|uniref:Uncharacterized protein n=1 Tax=Dictyocaulus viviparus TaxID=29172 RepID=A0A0D8Y3R2_DICVI|nr:hypothetical protein DICVIV_04687 [Dictyocaulus viviparus]
MRTCTRIDTHTSYRIHILPTVGRFPEKLLDHSESVQDVRPMQLIKRIFLIITTSYRHTDEIQNDVFGVNCVGAKRKINNSEEFHPQIEEEQRPLFTIAVLVSGVVGGLAVVIAVVYLYRFCLKKRLPVTTLNASQCSTDEIAYRISEEKAFDAMLSPFLSSH